MQPRSSNKKIKDDFVELPKINFNYQQNEVKKRKNSDVNINLPYLDEEQEYNKNQKTHAKASSDNESDYLDEIEEQKDQWSNWNINHLKVNPAQNNYIDSEDVLLPHSKEEHRKKMRKNSRQLERQMQRRERERNM